jgi:NADH-quinone oxidoreductase subunit G
MCKNRLTQTDPSLNPESPQLVNVTIDGIKLQVPKDENIIESAKRVGVDIPYFCYHPRLSKGDAANCRMCLVESGTTAPDGTVRMMPKPQTACTLPAAEGMVIVTDSERVAKDRRGVLEFLLINHPLDCPICDRGGECPLQNNALFYGPPTTRYIEEKRHFPKAYPLAEYVVFDRERCIHCARCTRFTEDISGDAQLGFLKRGADMEVGTYAETSYKSRFSGNVIEICPVGALLSRTYRFKARPWDLHTQQSVCSLCSNGCNIKIDYRLDQLQRVNARVNEEVNEEWTCDRGKFGHDYVSSQERLTSPMQQVDGHWYRISWSQAYELLAGHLAKAEGNIGGIGGQRCTNEDNFLFQKLFRSVLKSNNLDSRTGRYSGPSARPLYDRFGHHGMGNAIAELENMKTLFVLGADLADEQPILFLRVRKAWRFKKAAVVSAVTQAVGDSTSVGDFAALQMVYRPGTEIALLNGLLNVLFAERLLPEREGLDLSVLRAAVAAWTPARTESETGVAAASISAAARLLAQSPAAVLVGRTVAEHPQYAQIVAALGNLMTAIGNEANVNVPAFACNSQGAMDMGILPDCGPGYAPLQSPGMGTHEMLEAAASGRLAALWIAGADLIANYHDRSLVEKALEACPFVVVNELFMTETAKRATLVLPVASMAEKDGTYTSCERRVQRIYRAFEVSPDIKPDWLVFAEAGMGLGGGAPAFSAREILREIAAAVPNYAGMTPKSLGDAGLRWSYPESARRAPSIEPVEYPAS